MAYDEEDYPRSEHTWGRGRYDRDYDRGEGRPVRREMREYEDRELSDRDRWRGAPGGEPDYDRARLYGGERWDRERDRGWGRGPDWERERSYRGADWGDRGPGGPGYGRPDYDRDWSSERGRDRDRGVDRERFTGGRGAPDYENWNEPHRGSQGGRGGYGGRTGGYADLGEGYGGRYGNGYEGGQSGYGGDRGPNDRERGWRDREWWSKLPRRGYGGESTRDYADRGPEREYQDRGGYQGRPSGGSRNWDIDRDYGQGEWGRGSSRRR